MTVNTSKYNPTLTVTVPLTTSPSNTELFDHCIDNILVLDILGKVDLRKGGIRLMSHMFQLMKNLEKTNLDLPTHNPRQLNL